MTRGGRRALVSAILLGVGGALASCQIVAGINDFAVGDCKGGTCGPDGSDADRGNDDSGALPAVEGGAPCIGKDPKAIRVGSEGNTFCIDSTEVSFGEYQAFLDAKVSLTSQPAKCAWNGSFAPAVPVVDGGSPPDPKQPVTYVDWCDALAYCTWAGKYLCGKVEKGHKTGAVTTEDLANYQANQWLLACTAEARLAYPYGSLYDPSKCNLFEYEAGRPLDVGSVPGCIGGYQGIHDLIGNVWEWYDGPCTAGQLEADGGDGGPQSDGCHIRGGSYGNQGAAIDCRFEGTIRRDLVAGSVGIRCCSD